MIRRPSYKKWWQRPTKTRRRRYFELKHTIAKGRFRNFESHDVFSDGGLSWADVTFLGSKNTVIWNATVVTASMAKADLQQELAHRLAEGLMVGFRFEEAETEVQVYPIYVKNRDPRVNYQPKVLRGSAGRRTLQRLAEMSGEYGRFLTLEAGRAVVRLPASREKECCA